MKKYVFGSGLLTIILLMFVFTVIQAAAEDVSAERREQILDLALAYKFGELPENFVPSEDPLLQAIQELSLAESRYMLEYIYVFNRAGYPQEMTTTEDLIPYTRQRELADVAASSAVLAQVEQVPIQELLPDNLPVNEQTYLQTAAEGLTFVLQGKGDEYLSGSELLARDTILLVLRKHGIGLFAEPPDGSVVEEDAEFYIKSQRAESQASDYCGYQFIEGPGAQIDYGLFGGLSGSSAWLGDNDRNQTLCDHVVQYPVISQNLRVDHDGSYDGWCILNYSGGDGAWLARQRVYNGENVLYGGWKAQWCAVTGSSIAQHTRGG